LVLLLGAVTFASACLFSNPVEGLASGSIVVCGTHSGPLPPPGSFFAVTVVLDDRDALPAEQTKNAAPDSCVTFSELQLGEWVAYASGFSGPGLTCGVIRTLDFVNATIPLSTQKFDLHDYPNFQAQLQMATECVEDLIADAGPDQTVDVTTVVTLDGSGSTGSPTSYDWVLLSAPTRGAQVPGIIAAAQSFMFTVDEPGTYEFELKVSTGPNDNDWDTVVVRTNPPAIETISPASGLPGTSVTIAGANFSPSGDGNEVTIGGVAASVTSTSHNQLQADVSQSAPLGESPVTVTVVETGEVATGPNFEVVSAAPPLGVIHGIYYDTAGVTPVDSVFLTMGPVAGFPGTGARGRTGRQNMGDPDPVPAGGYRFEVEAGRYAMFATGVVGSRWFSTLTPGDTADVVAGDTTELNLSAKRGYHLDMLQTDLTVTASAGATIDLVIHYHTWNPNTCQACAPAIAIGVDSTALNAYRLGAPGVYPGKTEQNVAIEVTVPNHPGTIWVTLATVSTAPDDVQPALDFYTNRWNLNLQASQMIAIGTLQLN
jgi:hypothetical protein